MEVPICHIKPSGRKNIFVRRIFHTSKQFPFFFFFLFPFVDNISSVWRTSLIQSLQCKVAFQPALYFLLLREREVWWDQFSKSLSLKTLTEIKKNYNSPHLKNKKQKLRLSEEEEKLAHKTNQWERDYGVSTMIKRMELLG